MTETLQLVEKLAVLAFLVSNMLATGLNLTPQAVLAPLSDARLVLIALALNFVLAPAFEWLLTRVFRWTMVTPSSASSSRSPPQAGYGAVSHPLPLNELHS